jgi:VWFA-related protein
MHVSVQLRRTFVLGWLVFFLCTLASAQSSNGPQGAPLQLQVNVDRVLVPVVVRDKQGRTVADLKKDEFQVFDNDKPRAVASFTVDKRGIPEANTAGTPESGEPLPAPTVASSPSPAVPERILVFLFDDMHVRGEDMAHAKQACVEALHSALAGSTLAAVVSISGNGNSGLTRDAATLQQTIAKLQPRSLYQSNAMECPRIDYYQADLMLNKHDPLATQDAVRKVFTCNPGLDAQRDVNVAQTQAESAARRALTLGEQDVLSSYANISEMLRRMAKLPGQRTLILVSSGFQPVGEQARTAESRVMDLAAQSNVTISALDARGLYTTEWTANERNPALSGPSLLQNSDYKKGSMQLAEDGMAELADGTGGTFFHNSNDLEAGFKRLADAPEVVYILELPLDKVKADGSYHRLKVKVDRPGVELQARRGYFMPKAEKK